MGAGTYWTPAAPTRGAGTGAEVGCFLVGLTLGTCMGAGANWAPVTATRGVVMGAGGNWLMATLTLGAGTGTGNGCAAAVPSWYRCRD